MQRCELSVTRLQKLKVACRLASSSPASIATATPMFPARHSPGTHLAEVVSLSESMATPVLQEPHRMRSLGASSEMVAVSRVMVRPPSLSRDERATSHPAVQDGFEPKQTSLHATPKASPPGTPLARHQLRSTRSPSPGARSPGTCGMSCSVYSSVLGSGQYSPAAAARRALIAGATPPLCSPQLRGLRASSPSVTRIHVVSSVPSRTSTGSMSSVWAPGLARGLSRPNLLETMRHQHIL